MMQAGGEGRANGARVARRPAIRPTPVTPPREAAQPAQVAPVRPLPPVRTPEPRPAAARRPVLMLVAEAEEEALAPASFAAPWWQDTRVLAAVSVLAVAFAASSLVWAFL